jgi:hypothetical protein
METHWKAGKKDLFYIGRTFKQGISVRFSKHPTLLDELASHQNDSCEIYVRFGEIQLDCATAPKEYPDLEPEPEPLNLWPGEEQESVLSDVEKALIYSIQPRRNVKGKSCYKGYPIDIVLIDCPWENIEPRITLIDEKNQ